MLQLAWRFLMFQKDSALAPWYRARTADARRAMLEKRALFADIIDGVPTSELKRLDLDSLLRAAAPRYNT